MNDEVQKRRPLDGFEKAAVGISVGVFVVFTGFWSYMIYQTLDLLALAYGWW